MRTTKLAPLGVAIIVVGLLTTGCGSTSDDASSTEAQTAASNDEAAAPIASAVQTPAKADETVAGSVEWKTDDPKYAERFGVDVTCAWKGEHVAMSITIKNRIDRSAKIALLPRYKVDGDWHGDSSGAEQSTELAAKKTATWEVDAGDPDGVDAPTKIEECAPQITSVELGDASTASALAGPFRATTKTVKALVIAELGDGPTDYGKPRIVGVDCDKDRAACRIAYGADTPVFDPEGELLDATRPIWKKLFSDPKFEKASITIWGQTTTVGGKDSYDPVLRLFCTREANDLIDWDKVDAGGLKQLCDYTALVKLG